MSDLPAFPAPFSHQDAVLPELGSRALFPDLAYNAFLAHAAISPASAAAGQAVTAALEVVAAQGAGGFFTFNQQRQRLRRSCARLLGVEESAIALTAGCTHGLTQIALALPWSAGDTLLTFEGEFPANVTPWQSAAQANGGSVRLLALPSSDSNECAQEVILSVERALSESTEARPIRWLAVSAVQFQTGFRMPLQGLSEVCRKYDVRMIVDGIQGCGVVPLDMNELGIDAFVTGAHKWLMGLEGAGFSYISPQFMDELRPLTAGWLSHQQGDLFLFSGEGYLQYDRPLYDSPRVFEGSTANLLGLVALEVGVDICNRLSAQSIFDHVQKIHNELEEGLSSLGLHSLRAKKAGSRSCILSLKAPPSVDLLALSAAMKKRGVLVSIPDGLIRIAPHYANNISEAPHILESFKSALEELR